MMDDTVNAAHPAELIQAASNRYRMAIDAHATALVERHNAKATLENLLAEARAEGRIEGKNEADREANARMLFGQFYADLDEAERRLILARADLDSAKVELQTARDVASLTTGISLAQAA